MQTNHTPGPWFVSHREKFVCKIWRRDPKDLYENGGTVAGEKPIATVWAGWVKPDQTGFPVLDNARLIAAAPDLLEALETISTSCEIDTLRAAIDCARSVIAKARL